MSYKRTEEKVKQLIREAGGIEAFEKLMTRVKHDDFITRNSTYGVSTPVHGQLIACPGEHDEIERELAELNSVRDYNVFTPDPAYPTPINLKLEPSEDFKFPSENIFKRVFDYIEIEPYFKDTIEHDHEHYNSHMNMFRRAKGLNSIKLEEGSEYYVRHFVNNEPKIKVMILVRIVGDIMKLPDLYFMDEDCRIAFNDRKVPGMLINNFKILNQKVK